MGDRTRTGEPERRGIARPDLNVALRELYKAPLAGLSRALGRGTALLVARVGDGEHQLLEQYGQPFLSIDATLVPDRQSMRHQLLRSATARLIGRDPATALVDLGPDGDVAREAIARTYGPSASHVMEQVGLGRADWIRLSLNETLAGIESHVPLIVFDAHRLDVEARWDVRELERPVLLVTRPEHLNSLIGQDAPFYGQAQTITLRAPDAREWMRALNMAGHEIQTTDLEWLLDRSRGRVATTIAALRLKTARDSHRSAWRRAVQNAIPQTHQLLALARSIHADAPSLLFALAEGRQPYREIPDAPSQRIARAMAKLRDLDVIERPERNVSQIADPLVEHAMQSLLRANRMSRAFADVCDPD